jgi:hypothetical protein
LFAHGEYPVIKFISMTIALAMFADYAQAGAADLGWLTGHWCGTNHGVYNEEVWLAPRAGSILGMHRDTKDGKLSGFEFFRIVEDGAELVYWTQPSGRPAIAFRGIVIDKNAIDFTNPNHDFPKRIRYRRIDTSTLLARIDDGTDRGPSMEWRWQLGCQ